jgi:hypothetical protein
MLESRKQSIISVYAFLCRLAVQSSKFKVDEKVFLFDVEPGTSNFMKSKTLHIGSG